MALLDVGIASVDITPKTKIRLNGYGHPHRSNEADVVEGELFARAIAIGPDGEISVLITVDNCAIPERVRDDIATRLASEVGLRPDRFTIAFSHSHSTPCLKGAIPGVLALHPTPADHLAHIEEYEGLLTRRLTEVVIKAVETRSPCQLDWARGTVGFARNRHSRTDVFGRDGWPVDHDLHVLRVLRVDRTLRAVLFCYACHCTNNTETKISSEWAGAAQRLLEGQLGVEAALGTIGCAADINPPEPPPPTAITDQGQEVASEVARLVADEDQWQPVDSLPDCRFTKLNLEVENAAASRIPFPVQTWRFGNQLAIVFLAGEVVVDYANALKTDYEGTPFWITAYSNSCDPGYIPSRWVRNEARRVPTNPPPPNGFWYNYEATDAHRGVYVLPGTGYAPDIDKRILDTVAEQLDRWSPIWTERGTAEDVAAMAGWDGALFVATATTHALFRRPADALGSQWPQVGGAENVKGLAAWDGELFCITKDNSLQHRPANTHAEQWTRIGQGPPGGRVSALAAANALLFAANEAGQLWHRPATLADAGWSLAGHAEKCIAMAASQHELFCVTYEGNLFRRPPATSGADWIGFGVSRDAVALAVSGRELYRVTRSDRLLRRALPPSLT